MGKWAPKFSATFEANVWNLHAVQETGLLVETRDSESETLNYTLVDLRKPGINNLPLEDPAWFSHVAYTGERYLLVHVYEDSQNPDRVLLRCYAMDDGKLLWHRHDVQFIQAMHDGFLVRDPDGNRHVLQPSTGEPVRLSSQPVVQANELILPHHYAEGEEYFEEIASYIRSRLNAEPVRAIDYAEEGRSVIISFYKKSGEGNLALDLLVMDQDGETCLYETLEKKMPGIADPPFLFCDGNLIFVKEKRHFFVYALHPDN